MREPIYITKPSMPPQVEFLELVDELWESRVLTNNGSVLQRLERQLCRYLDVENITLLANGHLALECALQSLQLPTRGEVITTPFTFVSTTQAIIRSGLTPVFCDVDPNGLIDPDCIESLITPKTCAILPVHIYGNLCDVDAISEISARTGLPVVYDGAHAFGVVREKDGKSVGCFGDITMYSFHATKVFHTFEGGALAFSSDIEKKRFESWRNFGFWDGRCTLPGINAKMSEIHAAMGLCNLRHIEETIAARKERFELYCAQLSCCDGIRIIRPQQGIKANYGYFPIIVDSARYGKTRDELLAALEKNGFFPRKYFHPLTSQMGLCEAAKHQRATPVAKRLSDEVLALPLYPDLKKDDILSICAIIRMAN